MVKLPLAMPKPTAITPDLLRGAATEAVAALKVLANTDRLLLLCQLSQGEMCVSELEETLEVPYCVHKVTLLMAQYAKQRASFCLKR